MTFIDPDRLPPLADDDLDEAQRAAMQEMRDGPRGEVVGPFIPLLRSPELMTRLQRVGVYLRYESVLPDAVFELAILVVARHWDQQFEWGHHQPIALVKGVPQSVIDDVAASRLPQSSRRDLTVGWSMAKSLLEHGRVDGALFAEAIELFGEPAVVELVATVGYYTTLALTMNAAQTPSPESAVRLVPATKVDS